jgi:hypothetical protein
MDTHLLRQLSDRITAPLPRKTRFLEELSGDVEALTRSLVADGFAPEDAYGRALEALVPDDETLRRLEGLHASRYRQITRGWSAERLRRTERLGLAGAFALLLTVQTAGILQADFLRYVSPFLWPVLASGAVVVLAVARKGFELWVKRDHTRPHGGLRALLMLSAAPVAVALVGVWFDVVGLAGLIQLNPELQRELVFRSLIQDAAMLSIALLFALFGALGWLLSSQWVAVQEDAHRRALSTPPFTEA